MRTLFVATVLVAALVPAFAFAPTATAVGICEEIVSDDNCGQWLVCVGYTRDSRGFQCTGVGVRDPICTCPPLP